MVPAFFEEENVAPRFRELRPDDCAARTRADHDDLRVPLFSGSVVAVCEDRHGARTGRWWISSPAPGSCPSTHLRRNSIRLATNGIGSYSSSRCT